MNDSQFLATPIQFLEGVGEKSAEYLSKHLEIKSFKDLLFYFPYKHIDRSKIYHLNEVNPTMAEIQLMGKIINFKEVTGQKGNSRLVADFCDETGSIELVWFKNYQWIKSSYPINEEIVVFGRVQGFGNQYNMAHPEIKKLEKFKLSEQGFQPIYSIPERLKEKKISSKTIQKWVQNLLHKIEHFEQDFYSQEIRSVYQIIPRKEAFWQIFSLKIFFSYQTKLESQ